MLRDFIDLRHVLLVCPTVRYHCAVNSIQLAGQVLVAGFPGVNAPNAIRDALQADALAGVILFKRNIENPRAASALIAGLLHGPHPPLVSVDQEGGRVARLGAPVVRLPPMRKLAALDDTTLTRALGGVLGRQLRALGFTMDFAPVLDVDTNPDNPVIGDRSFGRTPEQVIAQALAFADGLEDGGVLSCGKHFPGHGDTDVDSHLALPVLRHDRTRLDEVELAPFRAAGRLPALMTAHVLFESLDAELPATLSRKVVTGLLRDELGYEGVIISDDLEMKAVRDRWGVEEAGVAAIEAGCDALLVCSDMQALFATREALAARADRDRSFRDRLQEAARRTRALRSRVVPKIAPDLAAALAIPPELLARLSEIES